MIAKRQFLAGAWVCLVGVVLVGWSSADAQTSVWVERGDTGRLIYTPDAEGDRLADFSNVGYRGVGTAAIPDNIPNVITLSPVGGDDTTQIQNAINQVAAMPLGPDGYRGAVLLQAGDYDIDTQLIIDASGIVLRGVGQGVNDTVLRARNPGAQGTNQRPLIRVLGNGNLSNVGSARNMIDKTVPAGTNSFRVDVPGDFSVGDTVRIERPSTQDWIDAVGMDNPPNGDPPWVPGTMNIRYDRVITRIEGDRIFLDSPVGNSFEQQYGGGTIRRYSWNGAIENVGIENLRADADHDNATDEDHAWEFVSIGGTSSTQDRAQHVWVRNTTSVHFGDSAVVANPSSKWVTVDSLTNLDPVSVVTGSRRYTYDLSGHLGLVTNSSAENGRHDFVNNSTRPPGQNVFHNSTATNALNDAGPHQRWATSTLFDNIDVDGDAINVRNRGSFGTSHGWSGANMVIWNSSADSFRVQNPPTAQNWLIGSQGTIVEDTTFGPQPSGNYDSHGTPIAAIPSLYEAQVEDAADLQAFHWGGGTDVWTNDQAWSERATPLLRGVETRDYLVGDIDGFVYDGGSSVDDPFLDPAFETFIMNTSANPITGFDDLGGNQNVAFTQQYTLDAGDKVVHAWLALGLRGTGGLTNTDFVRIDGAGLMDFASMGWDSQINTSDTFVGVIDLGTTALLPILNSGQLSVQINDDTGVDWAMISLTVATEDGGAAAVIFDQGGAATVDSAVDGIASLDISDGSVVVNPTGDLDVAGDLSADSALATLGFGVDGGASQVEVGGAADLDNATIDMTLLNGFTPSANQTFDLLTASSISAANLGLAAGDASSWSLSVVGGGNGQILRATFNAALPGDADCDGDVDLDDFNILAASFGQTTTTGKAVGDFDNDGDTDLDDFNILASNFGSTLEQIGALPEPAIGVLLGALLFVKRNRIDTHA